MRRSEEHTSELQSHSEIEQLASFLDRLYINLNSELSDKEIKCFNKEMKQ